METCLAKGWSNSIMCAIQAEVRMTAELSSRQCSMPMECSNREDRSPIVSYKALPDLSSQCLAHKLENKLLHVLERKALGA